MSERIRTLVYYVSFGDKFREMTLQSIDTLITVGGYTGDIVVLTDTDSFKCPADVRIINCATLVEQRVPFIAEKHSFRYYSNIKGFITDTVDIGEYDVVLYLDSDVLINRCINETLKRCFEESVIITQEDSTKVCGDSTKATNGGDVLDQEGLRYLHGRGFCAGVVLVPGRFFNVLTLWHQKNIGENMMKCDQGNLHWVFARLRLLPDIRTTAACPGGGDVGKKVFLHYWCNDVTGFKAKYRELTLGFFRRTLVSIPRRAPPCPRFGRGGIRYGARNKGLSTPGTSAETPR